MRLLSFADLNTEKGLGLSRERIRKMRKAGTFPEPLAVGENSVAWREDEIDEWIETRPRVAAVAAG
jgi:prophage regulatory protein